MAAPRTHDDEVLERLDRIEVAIGQLASGVYGPTLGGSAKGPLIGSFVAKYERRRDEQHRQARVASAQQELENARAA